MEDARQARGLRVTEGSPLAAAHGAWGLELLRCVSRKDGTPLGAGDGTVSPSVMVTPSTISARRPPA